MIERRRIINEIKPKISQEAAEHFAFNYIFHNPKFGERYNFDIINIAPNRTIKARLLSRGIDGYYITGYDRRGSFERTRNIFSAGEHLTMEINSLEAHKIFQF